jgi:hypothetical protein
MVQIVYVRAPDGATGENQITDVRWYNPENGAMNVATTAAMVHFISVQNGRAYVCDGKIIYEVVVFTSPFGSHITGTDIDLLSLPRF